MECSFKDLLKTILSILGLILMFIFINLNYDFSVYYCNVRDIPLDYTLIVSGVLFVCALTMVITVFQIIGIYSLCKLLIKIPFINSLCNY